MAIKLVKPKKPQPMKAPKKPAPQPKPPRKGSAAGRRGALGATSGY